MRRSVGVTLAVVGLAIATRLGAAAFLGDRLLFDDEAIYYDAAGRLVDGAGFGERFRNAPGFPVVLAVFHAAGADSVVGTRMAQAVLTGAGAAVVLALAGMTVGPGAAVVAGLFYALDPLLVMAGGLLYPEAAAAVVLAAAVMATFAAADRHGLGRPAAAGLLLGVLTLLRPVAPVLAPVLAGWILVQGRAAPRRRLVQAVALVLGCAVLPGAWTYRNYRVHGALTPIATAGIQAAPVSPSEAQSRGLTAALLQRAREQPGALAAHLGREFLHFWELYPQRLTTDNAERRAALNARDPRLPTVPIVSSALRDRVGAVASALELGLAVLGLAAAWRARRHAAWLLLAVSLAFAAGYAPFRGKIRYRIPVVPLVMVLAGAGLSALGGVVRARGRAGS
jgi:hypothetical protein